MRIEATYDKCGACGHQGKLLTELIYQCDTCNSVVANENWLDLQVFQKDDEDFNSFYFCSWKCLLKKLPEVKSNNFVAMPFLQFKDNGPSSAKAFIEELKL